MPDKLLRVDCSYFIPIERCVPENPRRIFNDVPVRYECYLWARTATALKALVFFPFASVLQIDSKSVGNFTADYIFDGILFTAGWTL